MTKAQPALSRVGALASEIWRGTCTCQLYSLGQVQIEREIANDQAPRWSRDAERTLARGSAGACSPKSGVGVLAPFVRRSKAQRSPTQLARRKPRSSCSPGTSISFASEPRRRGSVGSGFDDDRSAGRIVVELQVRRSAERRPRRAVHRIRRSGRLVTPRAAPKRAFHLVPATARSPWFMSLANVTSFG